MMRRYAFGTTLGARSRQGASMSAVQADGGHSRPTSPRRPTSDPAGDKRLKLVAAATATLVLHATGLHASAELLDLEGIAPRRKAGAYAPETDWYKIKNRACTQAEQRWALPLKRG